MNADGSGRRVVGVPFSHELRDVGPERQDRLRESAAAREQRGSYAGGDLYAVNPDGSGLERLTKGASVDPALRLA